MPILILPPRQTPDAAAVRAAALAAGWHVEQLSSWRAPGWLRRHDLVLYSEPLFADVVTPALGIALLDLPPEWLVTVPSAYLRRDVCLTTLGEARAHRERAFIKPAADKCFPAGIYRNGASLPASIAGLPDTTPVIVSEPVDWAVEFRCFVLDRRVTTLSPYLRDGTLAQAADGSWPASEGEIAEASACAASILADPDLLLPPAVVLDIGKIRRRGWAVVEANAAWGSGIYGCAALHILPVLQRASMQRDAVATEDVPWLRPQYEIESTDAVDA